MRLQLRTRPLSWIGFTLCLGVSLLTACGNVSTPASPSASSTSTSSSVSVAITPSTATVAEGGSLSFVATVKGAANTAVTWSVLEGTTGGLITNSGVYTAPNTLGTYHVVATSVADATVSASAVVTTMLPTPVVAGTFAAVGDMSTARVFHTATLLGNGKVLIVGGFNDVLIAGGYPDVASAELYDPSTRTFSLTGSMTVPREQHSATLLADGRVLVAGGVYYNAPLYTAEIYDPSTGAFTAAGDLPSIGGDVFAPVNGDVTTLLPDGRVFVAADSNAEIYDPHSGTFTLTGPYADPSPIYGGMVTLLTNGKVLVTGCDLIDSFGDCTAEVTELFDPQSGTFNRTGPMTVNYVPQFGYSATLLADGRVLFVGGDSLASATDVEVYDPTTGTFASVGSAIMIQLVRSTRLNDGTVLISGGWLRGSNGSRDAELYVPASGTFESAGQMTVGRYAHQATLLPDGTVLITGGDSIVQHPVSSAEVYKPQ